MTTEPIADETGGPVAAPAALVRVAAVDDDGLLLDSLGRWFDDEAGLTLMAAVPTVEELLVRGESYGVVMLDLALADGSDPVDNVTRLVAAGHRVLIVSTDTQQSQVLATTAAGAEGYQPKGTKVAVLIEALHEVARGRTWYSPELALSWSRDKRPNRPALSEQEHRVVVAYASGATLEAAGRAAGVRPGTARQYLGRVKDKYRAVGRPAQTKLELAERVREDGLR